MYGVCVACVLYCVYIIYLVICVYGGKSVYLPSYSRIITQNIYILLYIRNILHR